MHLHRETRVRTQASLGLRATEVCPVLIPQPSPLRNVCDLQVAWCERQSINKPKHFEEDVAHKNAWFPQLQAARQRGLGRGGMLEQGRKCWAQDP